MADNPKKLEQLFTLLAEVFHEKLKTPSECSSADLNNIRQFLRDNNITVTSGSASPHIRNIVENLPYDEDTFTEARH